MERNRYSCEISIKIEYSQPIFEKILKYQISRKAVQWETRSSMWTDGRTDRQTHDEANSRFSQICDCAYKFYVLPTHCIYVFCVDLRINSDYFPIQH